MFVQQNAFNNRKDNFVMPLPVYEFTRVLPVIQQFVAGLGELFALMKRHPTAM